MCGTIYNLSSIFLQIYKGGKGKNGSTVAVSFFYYHEIFYITVTAQPFKEAVYLQLNEHKCSPTPKMGHACNLQGLHLQGFTCSCSK